MVIKVGTKRATSIPNSTLRDKRLALEELGMLVRLLSRPAGWEIYPAALRKETGWGRDKLRKVLANLGSAGYLRRIRGRYQGDDPKKAGTWRWFSEIYDESQEFPEDEPADEKEEPCPENPFMADHALKNHTTVEPSPVEPCDGERGHIGFKSDLKDFKPDFNSTPPTLEPEDHGQVGGGDGNLVPFPSKNPNRKPDKEGVEDEYLQLALKYCRIYDPGSFYRSKRKQWLHNGGLSKRDLHQLEHWRKIEGGEQGYGNDIAAIQALSDWRWP